ncbi:unnamed protein product [Rotaria socialis]|uniref:Uncharacterized protein n=1 Tax=Rotaria socialis TaxID=392032 RepID=A0A818CL13_9BILA|nr:unnamed protein product [Rotaria socialis]CAF3431725.1 unnamed protein product [Rotaria socialis]CAF3504586.1 unnamed protein product [Rotaria socialis]CAF3543417.1 unnamed protein product [Rotaria socialis]CAF4449612.1 unnamed protein product [Rotaria socialis]
MSQPFVIPDDTRCKRESVINCEAVATLDYMRRTYTVHFPNKNELILSNSDHIQITSRPEFLYTIKETCFNATGDCALRTLEWKIPKMIARNFNVFGIVKGRSETMSSQKAK